jgi:hypothetical protein
VRSSGVLVRRGRHADAAATADHLAERAANAVMVYNTASIYSRSVAAVAPGKKPDELKPEERSLRERYGARALALLRQAVKAGFKDAARVKRDSDLDPIRDRPDFQKLLRELEQKGLPDKPPGPAKP